MALRIPLPGKVLLSYLLVVALGALPTFIYLRSETVRALVQGEEEELSGRTDRLARAMAAPEVDRVAFLQSRAELFPERITLIDNGGAVLFDSEAAVIRSSHATRPEVIAARRTGSGVAHRVSTTTGVDTLYVARRVGSEEQGDVLRLAYPVSRIQQVSKQATTFLRNAQGFALSGALLLSLLAAIVLVRPLARLRRAADRLADGDFGVDLGNLGDDEIGDLGRALDKLVGELRRRMATAGAGEAMLTQLVEVLDTPVAIFEADGNVLTMNGAARRMLELEGPSAGARLREMLEDESLREALALAEEEGQPEVVRLRTRDGFVEGVRVYTLKRPGSAPLGLLLGTAVVDHDSELPRPADIEPVALKDVLERATLSSAGTLTEGNVRLRAPHHVPDVKLADAHDRLLSAVSRTLLSCAGTFNGRGGSLHLDLEVQDTRVGFCFDAAPGSDDLGAIRPLIEPLGGSLELEPGETTLWLPRA